MPLVSVQGVSKKYRIFRSGRERLKETLSFGRKKYGYDFWALQDINLDVEPGTTLGVLGRNGAGKSTLLNIIAGIRQPTSGKVEVNGRLVALSGLGAGFNSEFTGRENVMLNGLILGIERKEMLERFDDIAAFADIGEFIEQPIKTYSSGMRSRLGFAVAVNVAPDVLILDETLAAGDAATKETALQKMYELRDSGTTILLVSHGMGTIKKFCTEAVLLHEGRLVASGGTTEVIDHYEALVSDIKAGKKGPRVDGGQTPDRVMVSGEAPEDQTTEEDPDSERQGVRSGMERARIQSVELLDERLLPIEGKVPPDSTVTVRVCLEYLEAVQDSELVIALCNKAGLAVVSASTSDEGTSLTEMEKGERVVVDFTSRVPLQHGPYRINADLLERSEGLCLARVDSAATLRITRPEGRSPFRGVVHLPVEIKVHAPEGDRQGQST